MATKSFYAIALGRRPNGEEFTRLSGPFAVIDDARRPAKVFLHNSKLVYRVKIVHASLNRNLHTATPVEIVVRRAYPKRAKATPVETKKTPSPALYDIINNPKREVLVTNQSGNIIIITARKSHNDFLAKFHPRSLPGRITLSATAGTPSAAVTNLLTTARAHQTRYPLRHPIQA